MFVLNMEIFLQDGKGKFYHTTRVSDDDDVTMAEPRKFRGTHGDAYWGKAKGSIGETGAILEDKAPELS
jgi:hypothetical protein